MLNVKDEVAKRLSTSFCEFSARSVGKDEVNEDVDNIEVETQEDNAHENTKLNKSLCQNMSLTFHEIEDVIRHFVGGND